MIVFHFTVGPYDIMICFWFKNHVFILGLYYDLTVAYIYLYQLLNSLGNPKLNDQCVNPTHAENSQDIANLLDARFKKKKERKLQNIDFCS